MRTSINNITHHIGLFGNSPGLTPVVCNSSNRVIAVISALDYFPGTTEKKIRICKLCKDLLLTGTTRGLQKGTKILNLMSKINHNINMANKWSQYSNNNPSSYIGRYAARYCDAAHKYEEELIGLYLNE